MSLIETVAVFALAVWLVQLGLSYRQAQLFSKRIGVLRKLGTCATGLAGGMYRGRVYAVLVAHPQTHHIIKAERLQGLTVFARLKPVPQLEGYSIDDLLRDQPLSFPGVSPRVIEAARAAAQALQQSIEKAPMTA
ncbi:MAG TPA: transcriptional regulator GutM [Ktedonobacteraceae bacterium]|jgi:DNA-binding transcriptional regulator of glucitol operon